MRNKQKERGELYSTGSSYCDHDRSVSQGPTDVSRLLTSVECWGSLPCTLAQSKGKDTLKLHSIVQISFDFKPSGFPPCNFKLSGVCCNNRTLP